MSLPNNKIVTKEEQCIWISTNEVIHIHSALLIAHGGMRGVRDQSALEATMVRPLQKLHYLRKCTFPELTAAYGFGLATSHPFNDGNKRIAFTAMDVFLRINGHRIIAEQVEVVQAILSLAAGKMSEDELAQWVAAHLQ